MVGFDAGVLFLNQDPFERVRLLADRISTAPLRAAVRSNLLHGFYPQPDDINELFVERMFVNGIRDFAVLDSLHSWDNVAPGIRIAKRLGAKVTIALGSTSHRVTTTNSTCGRHGRPSTGSAWTRFLLPTRVAA